MKKEYTYLHRFFMCVVLCSVMLVSACSDDDNMSGNNKGNNLIAVANVPKPNPFLAKEHYSITHFNSAQTDAIP